MRLHEIHSQAVTRGEECTCGCGMTFVRNPKPVTLDSAPAAGTIGVGVGYDQEWGFHSIVWFATENRAEAVEFASEWGYVVKDGVAL